jgi:ABC-2 type transport system ATP-binding protein
MIISSHIINEIESILDDACFIKDGQIILSGNVEMLRAEKGMGMDALYREVFA